MRIKIKRLEHCFALPEYKSAGAAGADVYASGRLGIDLPAGKWANVPLGFCLELPAGLVATIRPRSGIAYNLGIVAVIGTIDSDYRGELKATILNHSDHELFIERGTRIAQIVIHPVSQCIFVPSEELSDTERGENGFGSTGL